MLEGKKVLLLTISLNGYEKELIKSMKKNGMKVTFISECSKINKKNLNLGWRIVRSMVKDLKLSFLSNLFLKKQKIFYSKVLKKLDKNYDYIFDFGSKSRKACLLKLKEKYPKAKFILYLWDDLRYSKNIWEIKDFFDKRYIFNKEEAEVYGFEYLSNFYMNIFLYKNEKKNIDIYYRGSMRSRNRMLILKKVDKYLPNLKKDISLYSKKSYLHNYVRSTSKKDFKKYVKSSYVRIEDLAKLYKKSKILLDLSYKRQLGLGLRPLEAIAANCKLITTNENIKEYDFYNENNIFVLKKDLSNIQFIKKFIDIEFIPFSEEIKRKYCVDEFIKKIFSEI